MIVDFSEFSVKSIRLIQHSTCRYQASYFLVISNNWYSISSIELRQTLLLFVTGEPSGPGYAEVRYTTVLRTSPAGRTLPILLAKACRAGPAQAAALTWGRDRLSSAPAGRAGMPVPSPVRFAALAGPPPAQRLLAEPARAGTASGVFELAYRRQSFYKEQGGRRGWRGQNGKIILIKYCCLFSNKKA
ncbi:hypothetical protein Q5H92_19385 [Hymenobacter sp. M29]|uniref:Uncharacterized protein n=1 Tax=Hymenobacter mellowenesis TaxID=3063995 RepID=A0ABT9AGT2_9BACT|nr:hypothetical protein [Hymenobacter sp. M29]MDO7848539.1 hypothetical protein [Hymenobacter sp. M29]